MGRLGSVAGVLGILVCVAAVFGRFCSLRTIHGFSAGSVLLVGTTLLVLGCFLRSLKK
jgi:hypothetical protein